MPDHCFATNGNTINENFIDFEVNYNTPITNKALTYVNQSISESNSILCGSEWLTDTKRLDTEA